MLVIAKWYSYGTDVVQSNVWCYRSCDVEGYVGGYQGLMNTIDVRATDPRQGTLLEYTGHEIGSSTPRIVLCTLRMVARAETR